MYDVLLLSDEEISMTSGDSILHYDEQDLTVSTVVTNKRIIFVTCKGQDDSLKSSPIAIATKLNVLFDVSLSDIVSMKKADQTIRYGLTDGGYFLLKDDQIYNYLTEKR